MSQNRLLGAVRGAFSALARGGLVVSILLLIAIAALVSGQVLMRNVFSMGLPWADELARWFGIALVYFTLPHLLLRGDLIAVELVPSTLKGRVRVAVLCLIELAIAGFGLLSLMAFAMFLERAARFTTPALSLPNLWFYMPALAGVVLLTVIAGMRALSLLGGEMAR